MMQQNTPGEVVRELLKEYEELTGDTPAFTGVECPTPTVRRYLFQWGVVIGDQRALESAHTALNHARVTGKPYRL